MSTLSCCRQDLLPVVGVLQFPDVGGEEGTLFCNGKLLAGVGKSVDPLLHHHGKHNLVRDRGFLVHDLGVGTGLLKEAVPDGLLQKLIGLQFPVHSHPNLT